jgi:DNA repair protein RadC
LSRDLLNKFGTFENIDQATITEICQIQGMDAAKAAQINAALKVGKRMAANTSKKNKDVIQSGFLQIFFTLFEKPEKGNSKYRTS